LETENEKLNCKQLVNIFWTGGWDSTYRVLCLSRMNVILQPHYIIYGNRRSTKQELDAIREITEEILRDPRTKCKLKPLILTYEKDIPPDAAISSAFERIRQHVLIGIQYKYLARYAKDFESIEIGIETGGLADLMINTMGKMNYVENDGLNYWEIDRANSHQALLDVFGHFRWPLYHLSKIDMKEDSERQGFAHIMDKTWFCHFPANNEPCGSCFPCRFTIEGGMESRLPQRAMRRYKTDQKYKENKIYQLYKRFRRKILNY
jgi:7-cyano-7-deazaguanine synthase